MLAVIPCLIFISTLSLIAISINSHYNCEIKCFCRVTRMDCLLANLLFIIWAMNIYAQLGGV